MLEHRGYAVVGDANSAASALELIPRLEPEALLVDVNLSDMSGFDLTPVALRERPGLAILLTSAELNTAYFVLARRAGARGFAPKLMLSRIDLTMYWGPPAAPRPRED